MIKPYQTPDELRAKRDEFERRYFQAAKDWDEATALRRTVEAERDALREDNARLREEIRRRLFELQRAAADTAELVALKKKIETIPPHVLRAFGIEEIEK